jgi:hypothetical protein
MYQYKGSNPVLKVTTEDWWDYKERWSDAMISGFDIALLAQVIYDDTVPVNNLRITWGMPLSETRNSLRAKAEEAWRHQSDTDFDPPSWMSLYVAIDNEEVTQEDLRYASRILDRYITLLHNAGRSY